MQLAVLKYLSTSNKLAMLRIFPCLEVCPPTDNKYSMLSHKAREKLYFVGPFKRGGSH